MSFEMVQDGRWKDKETKYKVNGTIYTIKEIHEQLEEYDGINESRNGISVNMDGCAALLAEIERPSLLTRIKRKVFR